MMMGSTMRATFSTRANNDREVVQEAEIVLQGDDNSESSSTPFDDDYFAADKMPDGEQDAILGLTEFTEALEFFH